MRFGPAGVPTGCKERSTYAGVEYCSKIGLTAMEAEFVRGVRLKIPDAQKVGELAKRRGILLSAHCPYFINTCPKDPAKAKIAIRNILETARVAHAMGAWIIVFHPGYYMGRSSEECVKLSAKTLSEAVRQMKAERLKVTLGLETTGGISELGTLEECIKIAKEIEGAVPMIDFAHIHARGGGALKGENDYLRIFETIEKEFGTRYLKNFHSHFSGIKYGPKGELSHLEIDKAPRDPPFKPLAKVIKEQGYAGTIISESPILEKDALKMQKIFSSI